MAEPEIETRDVTITRDKLPMKTETWCQSAIMDFPKISLKKMVVTVRFEDLNGKTKSWH